MSSLVAPFVHGLLLAGGLTVVLGPQNVFVFQQGRSSRACGTPRRP